MEGILPIYKPVGITSYDVIRIIKKMGVVKKIGHGGTLDPFAEGVLLILLGRSATKRMNELSQLKKTYVATARLGARSDTLDCTGEIDMQVLGFSFQESDLLKQIPKFTGEIEQVVPEYSAAKVNGKPRYKYAREGIVVTPTSKKITVHSIKIIECKEDEVTLEMTVSSGTYIRQLSYDILRSLGIDSYLTKLVRSRIGEIGTTDCATIEDLNEGKWQDKLRVSETPTRDE